MGNLQKESTMSPSGLVDNDAREEEEIQQALKQLKLLHIWLCTVRLTIPRIIEPIRLAPPDVLRPAITVKSASNSDINSGGGGGGLDGTDGSFDNDHELAAEEFHARFRMAVAGAMNGLQEFRRAWEAPESRDAMARAARSRMLDPTDIPMWDPTSDPNWCRLEED